MRKHLIFAFAIFGSLLVGLPATVVSSFGQSQTDQQLIARLNELTRSWRGDLGKPASFSAALCQNLDIRLVGNCEMYQSAYADDGAGNDYPFGHAFNTYTETGTGLLRFVLFFANKEYGEYYLVDRDAKLLRAAMKRGGG